jgi:hypothetical protein
MSKESELFRSARRKGRCPLLLGAFTVVLISLATAGCGGDDSGTASTTSTGVDQTTIATQSSPDLTAEELGTQIGTVYMAAVEEVTTLLQDKPEASAVKAQVETLKEGYITKLVALGRLREVLSAGDRAKADARELAVMTAAGEEPWYATYNAIWKSYSSIDLDFSNLVASFNILGQYANFDLLKQQAPEEATRLGVE